MSLTTEREQELDAIADQMYSLSASQRDEYNSEYDPDIFLCGNSNLESTSSVDIEELVADTTEISYEEIKYISDNLKARLIPRFSVGIKPGGRPSGPITGSK